MVGVDVMDVDVVDVHRQYRGMPEETTRSLNWTDLSTILTFFSNNVKLCNYSMASDA